MHRVTRVILHIDDIKFWVCFEVYQDKTYVIMLTKVKNNQMGHPVNLVGRK